MTPAKRKWMDVVMTTGHFVWKWKWPLLLGLLIAAAIV